MVHLDKIKSLTLLAVVLTLFNLACTFTVTMPNQAKFKSLTQLDKELDSLVHSESNELNGQWVKVDGKKKSVLKISILNAQNSGQDQDSQLSLGKTVVHLIKSSLTDTAQFEIYQISFISKINEGVLTKEKTRTYSFE